ncbi:hypothetical protein QTG54_002140 [Skeletonema marinoi]|uniref:Uncharacterized protein n=1 Tax=Skeletonema marinoi TaxID=267567 RepID=A0AAD8YHT2_9STRA|nr:hypothetical protein QTG54_002140 [Skeletonema marinoi]
MDTAANKKTGQNEKALPNNNGGGGGGTADKNVPPPPPLIDPSKLEINSRILLLKNKDDDDTPLKEAIVKKLDLSHAPPKLRVHVDGKRKGILNTIGLEDIHSIIGRRNSNFERKDTNDSGIVSIGELSVIQRLSQLPRIVQPNHAPPLPQDPPIITSQQYHSKFCIPRRLKRLRQIHRLANLQQQVSGVQQQFSVVPTNFGGGGGLANNNATLSRRNSSNSSEGTRMIMEDLLMLQNNTTIGNGGLSRQPRHQQQQLPTQPGGVGSLGLNAYQDSFRNALTTTLPFGQGANPVDALGGGASSAVGGGGAFGNNSNFLMPPFRNNDTTSTAAAAAANAGQGGSLPQSAFSALDSLAPELREKMLRISKLAEAQDEGKNDGATTNGGAAVEKRTEKRTKKKKYEPKSSKKGKEKAIEKKTSEGGLSLVSGDSNGVGTGTAAMGGRRLTDFTSQSVLSPTTYKPESFFGMRNSMLDAAAMSLGSGGFGSGGSVRNVLGGSGFGNNFQGQINMMQLMGMHPPPFGGGRLGGGALRPPFGGSVGGGSNPGTGMQQNTDASSSVDFRPSSPRIDSNTKNEMMANLKGAVNIQKKGDDDAAADKTTKSGMKRKESSSSIKSKSSGKKKKAKTESSSKLPKPTASDKYQKPKRPFSAYNLFFQLEREFIMALRSGGGDASEDPLIKAAMEAVDAANEKGEVGKEC